MAHLLRAAALATGALPVTPPTPVRGSVALAKRRGHVTFAVAVPLIAALAGAVSREWGPFATAAKATHPAFGAWASGWRAANWPMQLFPEAPS